MRQLKTPLSVEECVRALREQAAPLGLLARCTFFRPKTSKVLGNIRKDSFTLESSKDVFSKRFVGRFETGPEKTLITYEWKQGLHHRLFGAASFDEEEILSFLHEWLKTEKV